MDELDTPTVLVDLDVLERNIERVAHFARQHGVSLRRHAKTHKTLGGALRQRAAGGTGLTVANRADVLVGVRGGRVTEVMQVLVRGGGR